MKAAPTSSRWMRDLVPPAGIVRRLALQTLLYAFGTGVFLTGSVVFFTQYVGASSKEVGLAVSVALAVSFALTVPLGALTDRLGARTAWLCAATVEAVAYACYPLVGSAAVMTLVLAGAGAAQAAAGISRAAYVLSSISRETRVEAFAFSRTALNVGFTFGSLASGACLLLPGRDSLLVLPLGAAAVLALNAALLTTLPQASSSSAAPGGGDRPRSRAFSHDALREPGFLRTAVLYGVQATDETLLTIVVPLWVLSQTEATATAVPLLLGLNTVLTVLLQVRLSRGADTRSGAVRAARNGGLILASSCLLLAGSTWSAGVATLGLLALCVVVLTVGEVVSASGGWGLLSALAPDGRPGEYAAAWSLGGQAMKVLAPTVFTWLVISLGPAGWLAIAALLAASGLLVSVSVAATDGFALSTAPSLGGDGR